MEQDDSTVKADEGLEHEQDANTWLNEVGNFIGYEVLGIDSMF